MNSGEAELYAVVRAAVHTKWLMSLAGDFNLKPTAKVYTDGTAALGFAIDLDLQDERVTFRLKICGSKNLSTRKSSNSIRFPPSSNVSDILTKAVGSDVLDKHMRNVGFEFPAEPNVRRSSQPKLIET